MRVGRDTELIAIGDVVDELRRIYPDVTHSSLRFLEREGLVAPARTPGGHRLYSTGDIARIRAIKEWQTQRLLLEEIRQRLEAQRALAGPAALVADFLETVGRDQAAASRLILDAAELGMPLLKLFHEVLRPALVAVGEGWASGAVRVGQEHEITEVARELIADLGLRHANPRAAGGSVLAACVAGERHDLGLRMVVALLRAAGCRVHFLGAAVDARFLAEEAAIRRPAAVILSATTEDRLLAVKPALDALNLAGATPPAPVFVGGQVVRDHADELRAWGLTPVTDDDFEAALRSILAATREATSPPETRAL